MSKKPQILALLAMLLFQTAAAAVRFDATASVPAATHLGQEVRGEEPSDEADLLDTLIQVGRVEVTAIKQGLALRNRPVAATVIGSERIERQRIVTLKDAAKLVPNFHLPDYGSRMTSTLYMRGLGARIDQPAVGLTVDNVPVMSKDAYDFDLDDIQRIEVLRGPQSTLYGRNTMGGVINIYTLSPLTYQGARFGVEFGSGNTWRIHASSYSLATPRLGTSVSAHYTRTDGLFENRYTGTRCDWEKSGGGRFKLQWEASGRVRIDNVFSFGVVEQGGYPYAFVRRTGDGSLPEGIDPQPGEIAYNDPCSYDRTTISDGLTVRYDGQGWSLASITSYQYLDDRMVLDQDFLPASYFTLTQARTEHAVTEDLVIRSDAGNRYGWLFGAFGFYRRMSMDAPVTFKEEGIRQLILDRITSDDIAAWWGTADSPTDEFLLDSRFGNPSYGAALYHQSTLRAGRWRLTAGIRVDYERARLRYRSLTQTDYVTQTLPDGKIYPHHISIDDAGELSNDFIEVLPKLSVQLLLGGRETSSLYLSASKGYKAGGFNTQMFSDVLQQRMMKLMGVGTLYQVEDVVRYKPEKSWNYELGGHFESADGRLQADAALFYIDCRDQQLTVFPDGSLTGRMMTNAGRTRSFGAEFALAATLARRLDLQLAYGYTDARFVRYDDGKNDYRDKFIPYAPRHTLRIGAAWTVPVRASWMERIVVSAALNGAGTIYWNEQNSVEQPFYALAECSVRFEHRRWSVDVWTRNLTDTSYNVFYFESVGNAFLQKGRPRTLGVTLKANF